MADELRIGYLSTVYHTSLLLIGTGWLESRFGIRPRWELFGGGPPIVAALAEDKLDVGYVGLPPVIIGIAKGAPIKCVAGGHMEGTVVIGPPDGRTLDETGGDLAATLAQFAGQAIGLPPKGSIHDVIVRDIIDKLGLDDSLEVKNYRWADFIVQAMEDGELKVAAGTPALATAAARIADAKVIVPPNRLWPNNPSCGIVARIALIEKQPELLARFLAAHKQAIKFINEHTEEAAEMVAGVVGLVDKEFVLQTFALSPHYYAGLSPQFVDGTMAFVPVLRRHGYIQKPLGEEEIFERSFKNRLTPKSTGI